VRLPGTTARQRTYTAAVFILRSAWDQETSRPSEQFDLRRGCIGILIDPRSSPLDGPQADGVASADPLLGLTLVYTSFSLPFCIWNMRAAFQAVPKDLEESAFLDGAGHFTAFWHVTLPLALPSIAIAGLIASLIGYSEFAMGWLFVSKNADVTLAMAISGMLSDHFASWSNGAAPAMLMSVPVVLICLILQRNLLSGLLIGMADSER
jgi:ABC-type maltose transport system permease subunit